jgi:hypothetical protein
VPEQLPNGIVGDDGHQDICTRIQAQTNSAVQGDFGAYVDGCLEASLNILRLLLSGVRKGTQRMLWCFLEACDVAGARVGGACQERRTRSAEAAFRVERAGPTAAHCNAIWCRSCVSGYGHCSELRRLRERGFYFIIGILSTQRMYPPPVATSGQLLRSKRREKHIDEAAVPGLRPRKNQWTLQSLK